MRATRSRTAQPLRGPDTHSAMGTWGVGLTIVVLLMFVAGFASAALYLETGDPRQQVTGGSTSAWPPEGIARPGGGYAASALALVVVAAVALAWATNRLSRGAEQTAAVLVTVAGAGWVAAALALTNDLGRLDFRWDEHAYTSVYWVLTISVITFVAIGALMAFSVLMQMITGVVDAARHLELVVTAGYGWFTALTAVILLGLVHLLPLTGGG